MKKLKVAFALSFLLTGCATTIQASKEDAFEVALDDSNVLAQDVNTYDVEEKRGKYNITFQTEDGYYEYVIGKDGIIQKKEYTHGTVMSENESDGVKEAIPVQDDNVLSDTDKQKAIQAACDNMGVTTSDVSNVNVKKNGNDIEVRFDLEDGMTRVTIVDHSTFEAKSSYTES